MPRNDTHLPGILDSRQLPDEGFDQQWRSIVLDAAIKDRLLSQAVLNFSARPKLQELALPLHGIILLVGPPGTGKTSLARGLARRTAASLNRPLTYLEVEPDSLASAALGISRSGRNGGALRKYRDLFGPLFPLS